MLKSKVKSDPRVRFSVIIPNHNGNRTLAEVLDSIFRGGDSSLEVIVIDDASTDGSPAIAEKYPVHLIEHRACRGAASARNAGAEAAAGEILVFIDNDVVIPSGTFQVLETHFNNPEISAVIGLLRPITRYKNLYSQYKNFYMHYTYMKLPEEVTVFYTSIAAIRRDAFRQCGGFDGSYRAATIEDMEFGIRVTEKGYRILIDKTLQVDHIRHYTLPTLLKTGFRRADGLAKIALRDRLSREEKSSYVTTSPSFLVGIVLSFITVFFLALSLILSRWFWIFPAVASYLAIIILNVGFLAGLARATRTAFFIGGCGLIFVDLLAHGCGVCRGVISFLRGKRY